jgi:hypothetical protein
VGQGGFVVCLTPFIIAQQFSHQFAVLRAMSSTGLRVRRVIVKICGTWNFHLPGGPLASHHFNSPRLLFDINRERLAPAL